VELELVEEEEGEDLAFGEAPEVGEVAVDVG
jgi:hypothetical protein